MAWQDLTLPTDEASITAAILAGLAARLDGWTPNEGAPEVALAEEFAHWIDITNQLAIASSQLQVAGVAGTFGFAPIAAVSSNLPAVTLTLQLPPSAGTGTFTQPMTVPAGLMIAIDQQAFTLPADITSPVTFTQVTTGPSTGYWQGTMSAAFAAVVSGNASNGGTPGEQATLLTASPTVIAATLTAAATGGVDAETLTQFLARFVTYVATLRPGGVRASELAALAATLPGVQRAFAVDLYDPAHPATPTELTVTIIPVDAAGAPVSSAIKSSIETYLESIREVNFVFHVIDPTYTDLAIAVEVALLTGADAVVVTAAVTAAITAMIDPASWGTTGTDPKSWTERTVVQPLDIAVVVGKVPGVGSITSVTVNGGTAAVTIGGPGALPSPVQAGGSTIDVTVG